MSTTTIRTGGGVRVSIDPSPEFTARFDAIDTQLAAILALLAGGGIPSPTLGTLTLSGALQIGTATSGTILGATTASTIASNIPGITVNSGARTYAGTPAGTAQTISNGLVETLAGAIGSPKSSPVTVAAAGVVVYMMDFRQAANAKYAGAML